MKEQTRLMEELIALAAFEQGCLAPSERGLIRLRSNPRFRPGGMITNLSPEKRAILECLTSEDLNKHRMDYVLIWTPVVDTWERFLEKNRKRV